MPMIVSSKSVATRPGVYGLIVRPPAVIKATGTGVACIVGQFPWGPTGIVFDASDDGDRLLTLAPPGMSRLGSGYLAITGKAWPDLRVVRVVGPSGTQKASATLLATATPIVVVTLKYVGAAGNSVIVTKSAASDGNTNHFNVTATVTGASGTTTDFFQNLNVSGVGADVLPTDFSSTRLVGAITKSNTGIPDVQSVTCSTGADGTVTSSDYVGTIGTGDKGLALTESVDDINVVFFDDPGNTIRAACNTGMLAHVDGLQSRIGFITGNSGQTAAAAQADVASYRSVNLGYIDPWPFQSADSDGSKQIGPGASWAASVAAQLSPSTKISWRAPEVLAMLGGIIDLEANRGNAAATNSAAGVITLIKTKTGGHAFEVDNNTNTPVDPTEYSLTRTRMGQYVLISILDSLQSNVNGPNVPATQQPVVNAIEHFMDALKRAKDNDPAHNPYVLDYKVEDIVSANPQNELRAGDFSVPVSFVTDAGMQKIFVPLQYGETVVP
jgi:hypothetical protein